MIEDKKKVFKTIKELFNLKGVYYNSDTDEPIKTLTDYICSKNYRLETVLKGIQRLESETLTVITNDRIEESIKSAIPHNSNREYPNCIYCDDMGIVSMVDQDGYSASVACPCGHSLPFPGQLVWNRQITQKNGNRMLTMANPHKLRTIVYE